MPLTDRGYQYVAGLRSADFSQEKSSRKREALPPPHTVGYD